MSTGQLTTTAHAKKKPKSHRLTKSEKQFFAQVCSWKKSIETETQVVERFPFELQFLKAIKKMDTSLKRRYKTSLELCLLELGNK